MSVVCVCDFAWSLDKKKSEICQFYDELVYIRILDINSFLHLVGYP